MATRRVTFRLYPSTSQAAKLFEWRKLHQMLYNSAVADRKVSYQHLSKSINYFSQQNALPGFKEVWPEYRELGSHALQATLKRVDFAFTRFFRGLGKYPRFKSLRHYRGWTYPDPAGWKVETDGKHGHLSISNLGRIPMRGQARTWGRSTTCTIVYRYGKWHASVTVECELHRSTGKGAIGIDLGCKDAITLSTGEKLAKPKFIKEGQHQVKVACKKLRRKQAPNRNKKIKASCRWKKARQHVSKLQRQVTRQRENWLHQTTSSIVSSNSLVAGEQLNIKGLTRKGKSRKRQKAGLNRSMLEVGFGKIGQMLAYKETEAGGFYVESPTRTLKPTQRCVKCWELTPKSLADRVHNCSNPACNHTEDRDINAAQVNLTWAWGQELASLDAEPPSSISCGNMRQLGVKKRQKLYASGQE